MSPSPEPTQPGHQAPGLDLPGLEQVYDTLAQAIDRAGEAHSERFLVKLALLQAQALGDADRFGALVEAALLDLAPGPPGQPLSAPGPSGSN